MQDNEGPPLHGLRVLEVGTYVAAPALGMMLALLGAEVIKVEPPGGDITRTLTPWSWVNYNFLKKSIVIDLKKKEGVDVYKRLAERSDVIVEALSPGTASRLGIGFEELRRVNSRLIYCSLKGFSSKSIYSNRPAFDTIAQAEGGLMHVTMSEYSRRPSRVGNPSVDLTAATFALANILAQVIKGQSAKSAIYVEVPLYDVVVFWNSYWFPYIDKNGEPEFLGSMHPGYSPYSVFSCSDGYVFIGVISDGQWKSLTSRLALKADGLDKMKERIAQRDRVNRLLQRRLKNMTKRELVSLIGDEVPCAEVRSLAEVMKESELLSLPGSARIVNHDGARVHIFLPPLVRNGMTIADDRLVPPRLGEHTENLLKELGYDLKEVEKMKASGAIG
ncbi:MAG: CaiB/BaiF CoA-transferase family protein [Conexivisphaerales archaeon]